MTSTSVEERPRPVSEAVKPGEATKDVHDDNNRYESKQTVSVTVITKGEPILSSTDGLDIEITKWGYSCSFKIYNRPGEKGEAFFWLQDSVNTHQRKELSRLPLTNIVSVHGGENIISAEPGGYMRAGNSIAAVSSNEDSDTTSTHWFFWCHLDVTWRTVHSHDFAALREFLKASGDNESHAVQDIFPWFHLSSCD